MTADLTSFGASPELVEVWKKHIPELTDIQEKAVRARVLDGVENVLAVAPTSSGKTFIGEMAATASAYTRRRHDRPTALKLVGQVRTWAENEIKAIDRPPQPQQEQPQ